MSWSTELFCNISFNRETFNTREEVLNKIDEIQKCLDLAKRDCMNLIFITEPKKFCAEEEDPTCWLTNTYNENMELIEEYTVTLYKLYLLLDSWDISHNKDGLALDLPENIKWDTAYVWGDFINTVKNPKVNE